MLKLERQNLVAAKENHEIAMERYMLGNLSGIEMREAQKSLLDAEERILSAEYDTKLCEISLYKSVERSRNTWNRMGISEEWVDKPQKVYTPPPYKHTPRWFKA